MDATLFDPVDDDPTAYQPRDARGRLRGDERLVVKFFTAAVKSDPETKAQGRPVFQDRTFIHIKTPGDQYCVINTIATKDHFERFPLDYQRFLEGQANEVVGTPLTELKGITPAKIKELHALDIKTIEVLAELGDEMTRRYAGFPTLKSMAQDYLKRVNDAGYTLKQQAELAKRDDEIAELRKMVEQLMNQPKGKPKAEAKAE